MSQLPVPFLNRLVDQMFPHADPKADQNIWNLARAAEEVMRQENVERFFETGDPRELAAQPSLTGRIYSPQLPMQHLVPPPPGPPQPQMPDAVAQLGEIIRLLAGKVPAIDGTTVRDKVDNLIQDHQAASQNFESAAREVRSKEEKLKILEAVIRKVRAALDPDDQFENESIVAVARQRVSLIEVRKNELQEWRKTAGKLLSLVRPFQGQDLGESREKLEKVLTEVLQIKNNGLQEAHDTLEQIRSILDPDGEFEDDPLTAVAGNRMHELAVSKRAYSEQQKRLGTVVEDASAERLRVLLGAGEHETLAAAAQRVAESAKSGWEQYRSLNEFQNNALQKLDSKVRELVGAIDESESDDHYMPEQPTLDAVRRLVHRLIEVDRHPDGSRKPAEEIISEVQDSWNGSSTIAPLSWERGE